MNRNAQIRINRRVHNMLIELSKSEQKRQGELTEEAIIQYVNKRRRESEIIIQ